MRRTSRTLSLGRVCCKESLDPSPSPNGEGSEYCCLQIKGAFLRYVFIDYMTLLHCQHLQQEIDHFMRSIGEGMVDKEALKEEIIGKWSIKPSLAAKLVDIIYFANSHQELTTELITREFQLTPTTAKRYLRQLVSFGFLQSEGANRNRKYRALYNSN